MSEKQIKKFLADVQRGRISVQEGCRILIGEMGRGEVSLYVDQNIDELYAPLAEMGYTVTGPAPGMPDEQILPELRNKVFITNNTRHFSDDSLRNKYRYALISIEGSKRDAKEMLKAVTKALNTYRFHANRTSWVKASWDNLRSKWNLAVR